MPDTAEVVWLHRGPARVGQRLVEAVRAMDFPAGRVHAFVHGEAGFVKELRRHLRLERGVPREQLSISGYWRLGHDEDGWQSSKKEWNAQVEAEQESGEPRPPPPRSALGAQRSRGASGHSGLGTVTGLHLTALLPPGSSAT